LCHAHAQERRQYAARRRAISKGQHRAGLIKTIPAPSSGPALP
jgi:hypothetical protein